MRIEQGQCALHFGTAFATSTPMSTPRPTLTDPLALGHHRHRAQDEALFFHRTVREDVEDRLADVSRAFSDVTVISPFPQVWAGFGAALVPDGDILEFEPNSQDLIVHALCLHWADDPVGQLVQCRRALRPDGLFIGALFGGQTLHELRAALAEAEVATTGGLSPRILPMGEIRDLGALLARAGFALPVADSATSTVSYADATALMYDLRAMGEANALAERNRKTPPRNLFSRLNSVYSGAQGGKNGRIPATFEVITLTGWAPSADQPKPLRPGSAQTRLADALGAKEFFAKD